MNLGDVFAVVALLVGLGIALPGLLLAWSLLLPSTVDRARQRLERTPFKCFALGLLWLCAGALPIAILLSLKVGGLQFIGYAGIVGLWLCSSIGASGLAALMGERLRGSGVNVSAPGALLRGAIALELAEAFPFIGWFVVIPLSWICSLGAAGFALLHWMPQSNVVPAVAVSSKFEIQNS